MIDCKTRMADNYKAAGRDPCDSKYDTEIAQACDTKCSSVNQSK